jgi:ankyrin repeat protein
MHLRSADQSAPTPLDRAVIAGNVDAVRSLIREGGDVVNGSPDDGETPLHLLMGSSAVKSEANRLAVAQLLLDAGADRLARTWWNEIPYDLAIFYNREAKLIALVDPDAPAPIAIKCPQCGREGRVPADQAGVYLRCKCGHTFQVPAPGKPAEAGADHASQAKAWRDQARAQGKTDEEIRAAMRQAGWGQEEIEALLSEPGP